MSGGQISYDLRRLRAHQIIERIPHSRNYQLTADGLSTALFFTRLTRRVIIPALAEIAAAGPPPGGLLRQADRAYKTAIADLASQASSASSHDPHPSAAHIRHQPQHPTQADSTGEIPAGKETYTPTSTAPLMCLEFGVLCPDLGVLCPDLGVLCPDLGVLCPDLGVLCPDLGVLCPDLGVLCLGQSDAIDATVVCLAADGDDILTSDPGDLRALAEAAEIHVELVPV